MNASDKLINASIILSGLSILFKVIVENVSPLNKYFEHSFLMPIISILLSIGLTLFIVVSIIAGLWNIRRNGINRKAIFTLGGGIVMGLGLSALLLILYYGTNLSYHSLQSAYVAEDQIGIKHAEHLQKPVLKDRPTASLKYHLSGAKSKYLDAEGTQQIYIPGKDDIQRREECLKQKNEIKQAMDDAELTLHESRRIIPVIGFALILPAFIGLFMPASWIGVSLKKKDG